MSRSLFQPHCAQPLPKSDYRMFIWPTTPSAKLLNLYKYLCMCYICITMPRYFLPEQFQSLCFAKWNIRRKPLKQPLNSFIVPSIDLLKLWEFLYTLTVWTYMMLHFYFEKKKYVSLALRNRHLRVEGMSFYIQIPHQFSNSVNQDYKLESHSKGNKLVCGQFH